MPVPVGALPPEVADYLDGLERRLELLENPQQPVPVPPYATTSMPPAEDFRDCVLRNTTLNILAHSDGTNWIRQDTGAAI